MDPMILAALYIVLGITITSLSITQLNSISCSDKDPECVKDDSDKKVYVFTSLIIGIGFIIAAGYQFYKNYPSNKALTGSNPLTGSKPAAKFYF